MTFIAILGALAAFQGAWTWTLYEDTGQLVLAHEIPDTARLKTILECQPGSGVARLDLFGAANSGIAMMISGSATATGTSEAAGDHQSIALRTNHPVFGQFVVTGALDVAVAGRRHLVEIDREHLAKLHRFAELCGG